MTYNNRLRLLALLPTSLLAGCVIGNPLQGYYGLYIVRGLMTVLLGNMFVALFGNSQSGRRRYHYPSGGNLR
jgi:hypothetical protein